ncbi:MAG: extracellular solute-binding protein [Pseudomonadota bacterium]
MKKLLQYGALAAFLGAASPLIAQPSHGIAMHGQPDLSPDFTHLPYVNADAPKGGKIVFGEVGSFDNLNPFVLKGSYPWEVRMQTFESLLARNWDEPFTLYGLLAESVEVPDDRSWVEFTLNPKAQFSDGSPVTVDDVMFSFEVLSEKGRPPYRGSMARIAKMEQVGERGVRFTLAAPDRELPLILGLRPILKRADWAGKDFEATTLMPVIGSGPYVVSDLEAGRTITLSRNPDYWGADIPARRGSANLDEIRIEYFRDGNTLWEAFTAGEISVFRDGDAARWGNGYGFPRAVSGEVVRSEITHQRPTGMRGFVFNTRNPTFADLKVREALTLAFDFEWVQKTMLGGANARIPSIFGNSSLAHSGAAEGAEAALLAGYSMPEGSLEETVAPPVSTGDGRNRRNLRRATALLKEAGWSVQDGVLVDANGAPFAFEILLRSGSNEKLAGVFAEALKRLGIDASIRLVDSAQYQARLLEYDFDMIVHRWSMSLSPGAEQRKYWGGAEGKEPGSRNHAGVDDPAVDAAIEALVTSLTRDDLVAAARALDRTLAAGRYVIPFWYSPVSRLAHDAGLEYSPRTPLYGDWTGFLPNVWWRE